MLNLLKIIFYITLTCDFIRYNIDTEELNSTLELVEKSNVIPLVPANTCYDILNNKDLQCDSEQCSTILTCLNSIKEPITTSQCNPNKPYCAIGISSDYCSNVIDDRNVACSIKETFECIKIGLYPNPRFCQLYYNCTVAGQNVEPKSCEVGYYYNTKTSNCRRQAFESQCYYAMCPSQGLFVYKPNPIYYYQCHGNPIKAIMFRCSRYETFTINGCTFNCRISGNHPHEDESKHYECFLINGKWKYAIRTCNKEKYDPKKRKCVSLNSQ